ncbi:hypothetical protein RF11_02023 [Thelohanellus kitauei]|uniref:Uncharacterized protein n=1 Tax=Thelohanellus kitauei TaxID=669202 RepID=A0A0C2MLD6_THEKT|nr:hypothetical protein RF11_02023 [Thelohanellus kitauei]
MFWFRKLPTFKKAICVVIICAAFAVSLTPDISAGIRNKPKNHPLWVFIFSIVAITLPIIFNIYVEQTLKNTRKNDNLSYALFYDESYADDILSSTGNTKREKQDVFSLLFATSIVQLLFVFFFWVDLIPGFGYSDGIHDFFQNFCNTFKRTFWNKNSHHIPIFLSAYIFSFIVSHIAGLKIIQDSDGSLYWSLVINLVSPCAVIFWMFFKPKPFHWSPHFDSAHLYSIISFIIIFPALFVYSSDPLEVHFEFEESQREICGYRLKKLKFTYVTE